MRLTKKILIGISLIILISCLSIGGYNYLGDRKITKLALEELQNQIDTIQEEYNNLLDNDIELARIIGDNDRELLNALKILANYTKENIEKLSEKLTDTDIKKLINSSVFIKTIFGLGSGTIIKKTKNEMYVLTCYHVVAEIIDLNEQGLFIRVSVGYTKNDNLNKIAGMTVYGAEIIKYNEELDLALLKIHTTDNELEVVSIAEKEPKKGDIIYSVGNPLGLLRTISKGILSNKRDGFFITDNITTYGNSGGGLFNNKGELIGVPSNVMGYIVEEYFVPETSLGLSRDLNSIKEFLEDVI